MWYAGRVADVKVRNLDDRVAEGLRRRAKRHGISLEEEARRVLSRAVAARRVAVCRRAAALRKSLGGAARDAELDSALTIRADRDASG